MHVLHVIPALAARYGGPSTAIVGICRALESVGVTTLVAATDADGPSRLDVPLRVPITYREIPAIFFSRRASESFKWSPQLADWMNHHVRDFDLVHVHAVLSHSSMAAGRACLRERIPFIVRPLGTLDPWSLAQKPVRKRILLGAGARRVLQGASCIHYTSPEEQQLAEASVPGLPRGVVIPLGIDDVFFESTPAPEPRPTVLVISRLHGKKRLELLIAAFHRVHREPWRLIIAGDGDAEYVGTLKQAASAGPAASAIEFPGWVDGPRKLELLRHAGVFVMPSHQENFGLGLLEAMAAAVPVVVTSGVNLASDITAANAGWIVAADVESLAGTLERVLGDRHQLTAAGGNARLYANRFRWPRVASLLKHLYDDITVRRTAVSAGLAQDNA